MEFPIDKETESGHQICSDLIPYHLPKLTCCLIIQSIITQILVLNKLQHDIFCHLSEVFFVLCNVNLVFLVFQHKRIIVEQRAILHKHNIVIYNKAQQFRQYN